MNSQRNINRSKKNLTLKVLTAVICLQFLVIGFLVIQLNPQLVNALVLATTAKAETLTELYFENYPTLSHNVSLDEPYAFSFTIHNLESQDLDYPYEISIESSGKKQILIQDTVFVKNNEFKTISVTFSRPPVVGRSAVTLMLLNKNQRLNFWLQGS